MPGHGGATVRRTLFAGLALILLLGAADLRRDPSEQVATRAAIAAIHGYQATLSRLYQRMGVRCRFDPTCSHYGEACLRRFGAVRGGWMAARRVLRCGPWTPMGTVDPPPARLVS